MARGLAYKRHHRRRVVKKALRDLHHWEVDSRWIEKNASTITKCSCPMCGNPRRHFGEKTKQERLVELEKLGD